MDNDMDPHGEGCRDGGGLQGHRRVAGNRTDNPRSLIVGVSEIGNHRHGIAPLQNIR